MVAASEIEHPPDRTERIRQLNDAFRGAFVGGVVTITAGFEQLDPKLRAEFLRRIRDFNSFDEGNDPHAEHDFGSVDVADTRVFWRIDYYDRTLQSGSDDPADPIKTTRVLTVMLASEY